MKTVEVTLVKSLIGRKPNQIKTAEALGLKKINQTVIKEINEGNEAALMGMINTISHLVKVVEK